MTDLTMHFIRTYSDAEAVEAIQTYKVTRNGHDLRVEIFDEPAEQPESRYWVRLSPWASPENFVTFNNERSVDLAIANVRWDQVR